MKLLKRHTDYAIIALLVLAKNKSKKIFSVAELAKTTKIPYQFLRGILQHLHKHKLLKAYKGKNGGFSLATSLDNVSLLSIIRIFQGEFKLNECLFRKMVCPNINRCVLRKRLKKIESYFLEELEKIKLGELI
ncbi:MAG: Rrf2 family transcriptional regulator [Candidatus Omnitrophica bacterium]|nr:Rrf2 family transcriptional regulator [Candidatus Omnitrophota bacterium]